MLGAVLPAQAALVTRHVGVTLNAAAIESFDLDVDLDGMIDFIFSAAFVPDPTGDSVSAGDLFASASFDQGNLSFFIQDDTRSGNFDGRSGFVGLRFDGAGGNRFGFAQVSVNALEDPDGPFDLTIGLVGYEDVPGVAAHVSRAARPPDLPSAAATPRQREIQGRGTT